MIFKQFFYLVILLAFSFSFSQASLAADGCEDATDLLFRAYYLRRQGRAIFQQKFLFNRALQLCPNRPEIHSALAAIFEEQGEVRTAIYHYQQAINLKPNFSRSWSKLGQIFYQEQQFPLSLEAYSHACQMNPSSKAQVIALLKNKRYTWTTKEQLTNKESLLVLFNPKRRQNIQKMFYECDLEELVHLFQPKHTFFNLSFEINEAILSPAAELQLQEIGSALLELSDKLIVHIHGHSDNRPFQYDNPDQSLQRNLELSQQRALAVAQELEEHGIAMTRFQLHPHGDQEPLTQKDSPHALAKNRRIEIEVKIKAKKKKFN